MFLVKAQAMRKFQRKQADLEAELGFSTGSVYTVTYKDGSNTVKGGTDRYFKMDNGSWIFTISSYSAENMMKTRKDLVKAKPEPEPKKEEAKK